MILLQQAGLLPHPEKPSSLPMSVATRPRATSPLSPPKSLGLGPSFYHAQDEELAKVVEQDPMLEELCKPLCCKLCNVTLNSAQQAQAHYQGKNHSKKLRNYYAANSCPAPARMSNSVETVPPQVVSLPAQVSCKPLSVQKREAFALSGSLHVLSEPPEGDLALCEMALWLAELNQDFSVVSSGPYFNPRSRQRIPRDLAMCVTPSGQFYCSMCNAGASEEMEFRQHLESKQHKSKVSEQRYRNEMENLGYVQ
uniref:Zinc finger matrin-type protein 3 n=1 Tax=Pavo cristatus TaxID=9049 RepID=A0A8C9FHZ2_PAVCR